MQLAVTASASARDLGQGRGAGCTAARQAPLWATVMWGSQGRFLTRGRGWAEPGLENKELVGEDGRSPPGRGKE